MVSQARRLLQRLGTADKFLGESLILGSIALTIQIVWQG
jgi:hypothetical protein